MSDDTREKDWQMAKAEVSNALNSIIEDRRNVDPWERVCLYRGISAFSAGLYMLAMCEARLAMLPASERSPAARLPSDPILSQLDLPLLSQVWNSVREAPMRPIPTFGPVELKAG